ncbi:zinc finger protein 862-like [Pecten maximus]|uniref:zinc finger protein 862-like n=1 Tax=Pecten maximus TaxID=6579 RepID=UPI001458AAFC|nr:zinc finger protein 862-like [Pecten maximus]
MAAAMLRYVDGVMPGKTLKRRASTPERLAKKHASSKKYEENRPSRNVNGKWQDGRPWLVLDFANNSMTCKTCIEQYTSTSSSMRGKNTFIHGCKNARISAVVDHESSSAHKKAVELQNDQKLKQTSQHLVQSTPAAAALLSLKKGQRNQMTHLFRNAHAVLKQNKPLSDFVWHCDLDQAKGLDIGTTYRNAKAVLTFARSIANVEKKTTTTLGKNASFFSIMMDGSTDISGDEQEAIYIRCCIGQEVVDRFLGIGSPVSTCSKDLKEFVINMLDSHDIDKAKLVALGSDGASNMTGHKSGLAQLLRQDINPEMINIHCFAHRLELSFRDVMKKQNLYDKVMTLLIGIYYHYTKQYKNKSGLRNAISCLHIKGVMPTKVTGTRWMAHLSRGIDAFLRTFRAYEAHLSTQSHEKAKAGGLLKIMINMNVLCFILFLKEILKPLMMLSLKLQAPATTVGDTCVWVEATVNLLKDLRSRDTDQFDEVSEVLTTGMYQGIKLKGQTPSMPYKETIIDGLIKAIEDRFSRPTSQAILDNATRILHFDKWPQKDSHDVKDFGADAIVAVTSNYRNTFHHVNPSFDTDVALEEFKLLKRVLYAR